MMGASERSVVSEPRAGSRCDPVRLAGLALLAWATFSQMRPGLAGAHLAVWVLLVAAASSMGLWSFGLGPAAAAAGSPVP